MAEGDARRVIGTTVYCFAKLATSLSECARRYGARAKKKMIAGIVLVDEVETTRTPSNRSSTSIVAEYKFDNETRRIATLNIRSVHLQPNDNQDFEILAPPVTSISFASMLLKARNETFLCRWFECRWYR